MRSRPTSRGRYCSGSAESAIDQPLDPPADGVDLLGSLDRENLVDHHRGHGGHALLDRLVVLPDDFLDEGALALGREAHKLVAIHAALTRQLREYAPVRDRAIVGEVRLE